MLRPDPIIHKKKELQEFYDKVYAVGDIRDNDKLYAWITRLYRPEKGRRFLDVGCGGGWLLREAEKLGLITCGLDISSEAVRRAKENAPRSEILVGDGEGLPWQDDHFDYVASLGCLEHYLHPEKGAREIRRVLDPDGTAIVILPNKRQFSSFFKALSAEEDHGGWQVIERHATKNQWKDFLEENGLKVIKILKYNKYPEFFQKGTFKIKSIRKFLVATLVRYFFPFDLAQQFVYICKKKK